MIKRRLYLDRIVPYIDKPFIKVIAGIRRAGKSSLMEQLKDYLIQEKGIAPEKIAYVNFDSTEYTFIREKQQLVELEKKLLKDGVHYFLFDEVQNIDHFDEAISALFAEKGTDIFITGSNSKMLSSELSTFFTGRYVDFKVFTLNFEEYMDFKKARGLKVSDDLAVEFDEYFWRGGFPSISVSDQTQSQDDEEVDDIFKSIIYRDLVERKNIRNTGLLNRVVKFVMDNIGSVFSAKSISDYLKNEKMNLSQETIYKYVNWLEEVFIIDRVKKYNIRGKEHLKTQDKFYLGDVGLLYAENGRAPSYDSGVLENVVYHELLAKGYTVSIGANGNKEIDFIAEKDHKKMYLQVCVEIKMNQEVIEREFGAFSGIDDNYPKYVLTLEKTERPYEYGGIESRFLPEFLYDLS